MIRESVYMRWAKEHAEARYNLANSGLLGCTTGDLELALDDVLVNGPSRDGYPPLLEAIAERYGVGTEQVALGIGTAGANFLAFAALVEPGDEVLVERPTYEPLLAALGFLGADIKRFPRRFEDGYRLDLDAVRAAMSSRVKLIVITNPHNPSGVTLPTEEMVQLGEIAAAAGTRVLVDEVYRDLLVEHGPPSHAHLGPMFVATSSLTKSYGLSGLRCGWVLSDEHLAGRIRRVRDLMEAVGSVTADGIAVAAFRQLSRLHERASSILEPSLRLVHDFLREHEDVLECVVPARSMTVFPRLKKQVDSQELHDRLRPETSIVPGHFFDDPRHFRLGFAVRSDDVAAGLARLSRVLRG
ncbi:MAG: pyridoxal phosphate-dependent aminotransferase [Thermoanaerobaculia bacterium]|nr:pyridoxal phosphate-dependent aminotransferase [Thermoanaerobaculia bacterium]